ncbi:MAG TPA: PIG-L family deacetylase [Acidobacteriaceae bacterium]|jgi:LmbE family N-acetylglucosaminyl deacetylase|nr:PIG-L family deacetylase [Acidobacteriaceae bacterium]
MSENTSRRLLCVTAHPDDECFAFGGALMLAVEAGHEVSVLCFTDGQAATNRVGAESNEHLGELRREEFAASCKILGVQHCEVLGYQDAQLEFANFSETAAKLVKRIRDWKPDVVLTFGMDGAMNTHPDHTMVSAFTTAAYHWAASPKRFPDLGPIHVTKRLYYNTTWFFFPGRPAPLPAPWTVTLDVRRVQSRKFDAFRAHTSQLPLMEKFQSFFEKRAGQEVYTLAASPEPQAATQTTDLFAGLR